MTIPTSKQANSTDGWASLPHRSNPEGAHASPVGAHRRGARLSARQRPSIHSTDGWASRPHRRFLSVLGFLLACTLPVAAADPASDPEAAYTEAQNKWKAAQAEVAKFVDAGVTSDPEIAPLQATYQEKKARLAKDTKAWGQVADEDPLVVQAREELKQKGEDRRQITQGSKEYDAAGKAIWSATVHVNNLRNKFKPAEVAALEAEVNALRVELRGRIISYSGTDKGIVDLLNTYHSSQKALKEARLALDKSKGLVDPITYLESQKAPVFNPKSTLPPLTRYGWVMPFDLLKVFSDRWGYAASIGGYLSEGRLLELKNPESDMARTIELMKAHPGQYKLSVTCDRYDPPNPPQELWTRDENGHLLTGQAKSTLQKWLILSSWRGTSSEAAPSLGSVPSLGLSHTRSLPLGEGRSIGTVALSGWAGSSAPQLSPKTILATTHVGLLTSRAEFPLSKSR